MKTVINWDNNPPKDWSEEEFGTLPEREFECGRLEKGDKVSFSFGLPDGGSQEYFVEVTRVDICLFWEASELENSPISVMQWVYLKG